MKYKWLPELYEVVVVLRELYNHNRAIMVIKDEKRSLCSEDLIPWVIQCPNCVFRLIIKFMPLTNTKMDRNDVVIKGSVKHMRYLGSTNFVNDLLTINIEYAAFHGYLDIVTYLAN
jgi:hypothetical protein